jgi:hypothetical protein
MLKGHRAIESITLDREVLALKDDLMPRYARMIYNGYWESPERRLLQGLIDASQAPVNGKVKLKLYKGTIMCVGRASSSDSLFDTKIATFDDDAGAYDQKDAAGSSAERTGADRRSRQAPPQIVSATDGGESMTAKLHHYESPQAKVGRNAHPRRRMRANASASVRSCRQAMDPAAECRRGRGGGRGQSLSLRRPAEGSRGWRIGDGGSRGQ